MARINARISADRLLPKWDSNRSCACDHAISAAYRRFSPARVKRNTLARRSDTLSRFDNPFCNLNHDVDVLTLIKVGTANPTPRPIGSMPKSRGEKARLKTGHDGPPDLSESE